MTDALLSLGVRRNEISFQMSRSSGPGGQNVNKVNSKVTLRWSPARSGMNEGVKRRFFDRFGTRLTTGGELLIHCDESRDQGRNKEICLTRLEEMIRSVLRPPKKRRPTKPGKAAKERRITGKKQRGKVKAMRGRPKEE